MVTTMSMVIRYDAHGGPAVLRIGQETVGDPGPGEIRVVQHSIGVNPADLKQLAGAFGTQATSPGVLGFEAAGVVDAVGPGVEGLPVGARVLWHGVGAQREVARLRADRARVVPDSVDLDQAAVLPVAGATAFSAVMQAGVGYGTVLLVHGASGGVGSAAVQVAIALGARVVGTTSEANMDYVRSLGATPLRYGPGLLDRIHALPDGLGTVDAVIDMVADLETVETTVVLLGGERGDQLLPGSDRAVAVAHNPIAQTRGIATVTPSRGALDEVVALASAGLLHTEVSRVFPLERAAEALRAMNGHVRGKVLLRTRAAA